MNCKKPYRGCSVAIASTRQDGFIVMWFYVREHGSCSGLKRLRRLGQGLKSHSTDCT